MYKKIIILGGSGSGKTTLANRIARYTHYPVYHLDNLFLNSDWSFKDKSTWREISEVFLKESEGVVDGNFSSAIPYRIEWADLIIFIDVPTYLRLYRIFRRMVRVKLGLDKRLGHPEESKEKIRFSYLKGVCTWNKRNRDKMINMLESIKDKKVVIIRKLDELDLASLLDKK